MVGHRIDELHSENCLQNEPTIRVELRVVGTIVVCLFANILSDAMNGNTGLMELDIGASTSVGAVGYKSRQNH